MKRHVGWLVAVTALGLATWHQAQAQLDSTLERRVRLLEATVQELSAQVSQLRSAVRVESASVTISSPGTLRLQAAANLEAVGSLIKLNNGSRPIAASSGPQLCVSQVPSDGGPVPCLVAGPIGNTVLVP